jgi:hypothetical protein
MENLELVIDILFGAALGAGLVTIMVICIWLTQSIIRDMLRK